VLELEPDLKPELELELNRIRTISNSNCPPCYVEFYLDLFFVTEVLSDKVKSTCKILKLEQKRNKKLKGIKII
jgi:hypothetical protein